ncbi:MAG: 16S rRNA (guanine(527)-N(7))-methyltransferase RsmG [Oscillospiraceae bacterium]|nr:16S rRNA (guanine(527)-N(7))-methyltransferase RsmG [Oscillospiraceae bacterium]
MLEDTLREGFAAMGLASDERALARFRDYYEALEETGKIMNLTAIHGEDAVARLHFLDSCAPLTRFDLSGRRVIDVGTGAGFPGLPLKLLCPDVELTLLDSLNKRLDFLRGLCARWELDGVECVHGRAEEPGARREQFDFALSRAVARLGLLCELCLPYVRVGGTFLALKGPGAAEELDEARRAVSLLGGGDAEILDYALPGEDADHKLVVVRKLRPTPPRYPRKFAIMKKCPL